MAITGHPLKTHIDFTLMYVTHDAFRRDLVRLREAVDGGRTDTPRFQAGWSNFKRQLEVHHTVEDAALWPRVAAAVSEAARPDDAALLREMEAEHARLDPLLDAADDAIREHGPDLAQRIAELAAALNAHTAHEEEEALPLIQEVLTPKDWDAFRRAMARRQGPSGAAAYVPWILDGATADQRRRFLAAMPAPVKVINGLLWERRYRRRHR